MSFADDGYVERVAQQSDERVLAGRYELTDEIGRGGMGSVWRAVDRVLQRDVAVKRVELPLAMPDAERESVRARVMREARAAARVSHPRLVTVFDVIEEDGSVFIIQELVEGRSLRELVESEGPLDPMRAASIAIALLDGLEIVHRHGVVHRDVKPGNVLLADDGAVKLADFGIAAVEGDPSLTVAGTVLGSPAYMAPEQAMGLGVSPATDLWAVGATLYYAVEGEPPFGRSDNISTLTSVVHDPPRPFECADGPMASVIADLLMKDPEERPASGELRRRLRAIADGRADTDTAAATPTPTATATASPDPATRTLSREPRHVRATRQSSEGRGAGRWLVPVVAIVALFAGLVWFGTSRRADRSGDEAVSATTSTMAAGAPAASSTTQREATTSTTEESEPASSTPEGWTTYTDPKVGYRIGHPEDWKPTPLDGTRTDFRAPDARYLRVDWTDKPGPSARLAWEVQEKSFAARHPGYQRVRLEDTTFQGHPAALWEYTYPSGGTTLHAYNLGFVVDGKYGFALNLQTKQDQWDGTQDEWREFKESFRAP